MIKLVALDLDGTLLSTFGVLSKEAADTLRALRQKQIIVVISSGRPYYSVANMIPSDCYDYASCMNGQYICRARDQKEIRKPDLNEYEKKHLTSYLSQYRMLAECMIKEQGCYLADERHHRFVTFFETLNELRHRLAHRKYYRQDVSYDYSIVQNTPVGKICFCSYPFILKRFYRHLDHENYACFFVNASWLEIMHKGISKGNAIQEIMVMEGLQKEECAAFGDGENDISLLDACGTRVAMANAMHSLKKHATHIAKPYYEDGCAKWLRDNLL